MSSTSVTPPPPSDPRLDPRLDTGLPGDTPEALAERSLEELKAARRGWLWITIAVVAALPWLGTRLLSDWHGQSDILVAVLTGIAILSAAFMLSWAAEVFQLDVSQALALALL